MPASLLQSCTTDWFDANCPDCVPSAGATAARPSSPVTGQQYFDTDLGKVIVWDGAAWINVDGTAI